MTNYLRAAIKRFDEIKNKEYLINPISEVDSKIIVELVNILQKIGFGSIGKIFENYKYDKDEEVLELLKDFDVGEDGIKIIEETKPVRVFIEIENTMINVFHIFGIVTPEEYDENDRFLGKIIINPTPRDILKPPIYANLTFEYYNEKKFKESIEDLKNRLYEVGIKVI